MDNTGPLASWQFLNSEGPAVAAAALANPGALGVPAVGPHLDQQMGELAVISPPPTTSVPAPTTPDEQGPQNPPPERGRRVRGGAEHDAAALQGGFDYDAGFHGSRGGLPTHLWATRKGWRAFWLEVPQKAVPAGAQTRSRSGTAGGSTGWQHHVPAEKLELLGTLVLQRPRAYARYTKHELQPEDLVQVLRLFTGGPFPTKKEDLARRLTDELKALPPHEQDIMLAVGTDTSSSQSTGNGSQ